MKGKILNLLFLSILLAQDMKASSSLVVEFGEDANENNELYLNVDLLLPTNKLSYCIQIFVERYGDTLAFQEPKYFSMFVNVFENKIWLIMWNYGMKYSFSPPEGVIHTHDWTTLCVSINETSLHLVANGELLQILERQDKRSENEVEFTVSNLSFGAIYAGWRMGKVTNFNIWSSTLTADELITYSKICSNQPPKSENRILKWEILIQADFTKADDSTVKISPYSTQEQCKEPSVVKSLNAYDNFYAAIERCNILGGTMFLPNDDFGIMRNLTQSESWVPIVYRGGRWKNFYKDEPVVNLPWNEGEPNGFKSEPCVHTTAGGDKLNDNVCFQVKNTVCHFTSYVTKLRLRGLENIEGDFIFVPEESLEFLEFKNMFGSRKIVFLDNIKSWAIINDDNESQQSEIVALLAANDPNKDLPLGVKNWRFNSGNKNITKELTLSKVMSF